MAKKRIRLQLRCQLDKVDFGALTWYQEATTLIQQLYGKNWSLFADLLASTSPRKQVKANWRLADAILKAYLERKDKPKYFGDLLASLLPAHLNNVIRSLQRRPISGQKVWRFAENLKGNLDVVTIDVWICRAYGINDKKDLSPSVYKRLEKRIASDAKKCNALPASYQAVLWSAIRREYNLRAKSFVSVYQSIFCETPYFDFMKAD